MKYGASIAHTYCKKDSCEDIKKPEPKKSTKKTQPKDENKELVEENQDITVESEEN